MHNHGNYIVSLGNVCRWLGAAGRRRSASRSIPGFAAAEVLYDEDGSVRGVATGDLGIGRDGQHDRALSARHGAARAGRPLFAEGCRGSLTKTLFERFKLREGVDPQTYGLGIKELWEVDPAKHRPGHGRSTPSAGRSTRSTYGGSFLYHLENNQVAVGFVIGLDYSNPFLSPFEEFQRFKTHPAIRTTFEGGAAHRLRRARDLRGRLPVDPEAHVSRAGC